MEVDLGLTKQSNVVTMLGVKYTDDQIERRLREAQLLPALTTLFRSCVVEAIFQDSADLAEAVKSLAQQVSKPTCSEDHHWH